MKKRKLKPWAKLTLKIIITIILGFILINGIIENHYYLLKTKYSPQNKKSTLEKASTPFISTHQYYTTKGV